MKLGGKTLPKSTFRLLITILVLADLAIGIKALDVLRGQLAAGCMPIPQISACATIKLPTSDLSADFYNGTKLVAAGANSTIIPVVPEQTVRIDIRNTKEAKPDSSGSYVFKDTSVDILVSAGQSKTYVVTPPKIYHKGSLRLTCDIQGKEISTDVFCQPVIDGNSQPVLEKGATSTYVLDPGEHVVHVELNGVDATMWRPSADDHTVNITGGKVTEVKSIFTRLTLLAITLDQPHVTGDLFLNGELIGKQVSSVQVWVLPNADYQISGVNFSESKTSDEYIWANVEMTVHLKEEPQKSIKLSLQKQELLGIASVTCQLVGWKSTQPVQCAVTVDGGEPVGQVEPNKPFEIKLKPGTYEITVKLTGKDAPKWQTPKPQQISIEMGETVDLMFLAGSISQTGYSGSGSAAQTSGSTPGTQTPNAAPLPNLYKATLSGFGDNARTIFAKGKTLQRDPHRFAKVGDCETDSPFFLIPFDEGLYNLGSYTYLRSMVPYFAGSFKRRSLAGHGSFVAASVLDPTWADPAVCQPGETPLACEYRTYNPAFALIMLRTFPYPWEGEPREKYINDMRTIISYTIDQGIVPIVSTIPLIETSPNELQDMNAIIRQLAMEYQIPLWDFYATTSTLPNNGVKDSHLTVPPIGATFFNDAESLQYGMPRRNLEALQVLHNLYASVIR